ncbi:MAG: hypothetical protein ACD_56C00123G0009 [uncultured bacterium]|nr:MAG: hypothetical protein ACD_56C00123G0009 [uncultured bacterium]
MVTKEELIAELSHGQKKSEAETVKVSKAEPLPKINPSPNFLSPKSFSIAKEKPTAQIEKEPASKQDIPEKSAPVKTSVPNNIWAEQVPVAKVAKKREIKKPAAKSFWPIEDSMLGKKETAVSNASTAQGLQSAKKESEEKRDDVESKIPSQDEKVTTAVAVAPQKKEISVMPDEKVVKIIEKKSAEVPAIQVEQVQAVAVIEKSLPKVGEDISKLLVEAVLSFDERKINDGLSELAAFRSEDPARISADFNFNVELREKLFAAVPALLANKGEKAILYVFQLLDEMSIDFAAADLAKLPKEVLKSEELRKVGEKYLLWFAKEYPDFPGDLEKRIDSFARSGVFIYQEIRGFAGLRLAIATDLINFIKENVQDPHDVERKIYEFALAGLVDGKSFKTLEKVKDVVRRYILELIVRKKDHPIEAAKKIGEYEKAGFIKPQEVLEDGKIRKFIEKYLTKFEKDNKAHPRKISALVKEYFNAGLIDKEVRDRYTK